MVKLSPMPSPIGGGSLFFLVLVLWVAGFFWVPVRAFLPRLVSLGFEVVLVGTFSPWGSLLAAVLSSGRSWLLVSKISSAVFRLDGHWVRST